MEPQSDRPAVSVSSVYVVSLSASHVGVTFNGSRAQQSSDSEVHQPLLSWCRIETLMFQAKGVSQWETSTLHIAAKVGREPQTTEPPAFGISGACFVEGPVLLLGF